MDPRLRIGGVRVRHLFLTQPAPLLAACIPNILFAPPFLLPDMHACRNEMATQAPPLRSNNFFLSKYRNRTPHVKNLTVNSIQSSTFCLRCGKSNYAQHMVK